MLIDFDTSVLNANNFEELHLPAAIKRRNYDGFLTLARKMISTPKNATANNVVELRRLLDTHSTGIISGYLLLAAAVLGKECSHFTIQPK